MCWACNPVCGRCKPPKQKVATCPSCGAIGFFSKEENLAAGDLSCLSCGEGLLREAAIVPVLCRRSGKWCAWPCGQSEKTFDSGYIDCPYNTALASKFHDG